MTDDAPHLCPACGARVPCARGWVDVVGLVSVGVVCGALAGALLTALLVVGTCTA